MCSWATLRIISLSALNKLLVRNSITTVIHVRTVAAWAMNFAHGQDVSHNHSGKSVVNNASVV